MTTETRTTPADSEARTSAAANKPEEQTQGLRWGASETNSDGLASQNPSHLKGAKRLTPALTISILLIGLWLVDKVSG